MAYITTADLKAYLMAGGQTPPVTDDALLTTLIASAQKTLERKTTRKFEAYSATRTYDVPQGRKLKLDEDLISVTTLTNGDLSVIAPANYILWPNNWTPKRAIILIQGTLQYWLPSTNNSYEQAISVLGSWGYMTTADDDVKQVTKRLAGWYYRQKDSAGEQDRTIVAPDGTVLLPSRLPGDVMDWINDMTPHD